MSTSMGRENECVETLHMHVGICQRAGYANGRADQADEIRAVLERDHEAALTALREAGVIA